MPEPVHIVTPDGKLKAGPAADLQAALDAGARVATPAQIRAKENETRHAGFWEGQRAWQNAGLSGATAGLGPGVIAKGLRALSPTIGQKYADDVEGLRDAHPLLNTVGEAGGMIAGAAAGSAAGAGAGAAGLARLLPSAGIDALGAGVEGAVARSTAGLAERGILGRAGSAALSLGARGAAEGAAYGAAQQLGEDLLGDHELAADKLFMGAGKGALFGGVTGGVLGAGGSLASSGIRGLGRIALAGLSKGERAAIDVAETANAGAAGAGLNVGQELTAARDIPTRIGGLDLRELGGEQAWKSLGGGVKYVREAERAGGTAAIGNRLIDEGIIDAKGSVVDAFMGGKADELLDRIKPAKEAHGQRIGELVKGTPANVRFGELETAVNDATAPYRNAGGEHIVRQLEAYKLSLATHLGALDEKGAIAAEKLVSAADVINQRRFLDDLIYEGKGANRASLTAKAFESLRGKIEDTALNALDDAAKQLGNKELKAELLAEKRAYQQLAVAERTATESTNRYAANRNLSMSDMLTAGMSAASGHLLAAPVAGVAHKLIRERGNAAAAVLLHKMADVGAVKRLMGIVDEQLTRSAKGLLAERAPKTSTGTRPTATPKRDYLPLRGRYKKAREQVEEMQSDPEGFTRRASAAPGTMAAFAPNTSAAYTRNIARAAAFLASKLPNVLDPDGPIGANEHQMPPDHEAAEFLRYFDAVEDPPSILRSFERGTVTPEEGEALKAIAPGVYSDLQGRTAALIAERSAAGKPLPFEVRQRLFFALEVQTDASQRPTVLKQLQANVATPAPAGKGGTGTGKAHRPVKLTTQQSALDRLETSGAGRK